MNASIFDPYGGDAAAPIVERRFLDFLRDFSEADDGGVGASAASSTFAPASRHDYINAAHGMRAHDMATLYVNFAHLRAHDGALASTVAAEFYRCAAERERAATRSGCRRRRRGSTRAASCVCAPLFCSAPRAGLSSCCGAR